MSRGEKVEEKNKKYCTFGDFFCFGFIWGNGPTAINHDKTFHNFTRRDSLSRVNYIDSWGCLLDYNPKN